MRMKLTAKYDKQIDELSQQCQRKTDECYHAWMSLTVANEQLEKVRMELDNRLFKTDSLDQTVERQGEELKAISNKYEHDKKFWIMAISRLEEKMKKLKQEHSLLSREAHECADSIHELTKMVSAVQMLVAQCEEFKEKYVEEQKKRKKLFNEVQEAKGMRRPFWDKTGDGIFKEVLRNKPDFRRKPWPTISNSAKDFIRKPLVKDPRAQLTAAQALSHQCVREGGNASDIPIDISVLRNMRQFVKYSHMKQFALRALTSTLNEEELADLQDQFDAIDIDKSGTISLEEMRKALAKDIPWKHKDSCVMEIVEAIDSNTDGFVDFTEFVRYRQRWIYNPRRTQNANGFKGIGGPNSRRGRH